MALILVRPHTSLLDGPAVALYLRKVGVQKAVFAVDPDYARHRVWSRLLNAYGWLTGGHTMLPLDTSRPYALRTLDRLLDQGKTVVLFPQGTGLGDPDRPDAKGVDWLVSRAFKQDGKVYQVERLTRQLTLSHVGLLPRVMDNGTPPVGMHSFPQDSLGNCVSPTPPAWRWLFASSDRLRISDHFRRHTGDDAHV